MLRAITRLDVERLAEATGGWSVDDTELITVLATRSKAHLTRVSMLYRETRGSSLEALMKDSITGVVTTGWYVALPTSPRHTRNLPRMHAYMCH